MVGPSPRYIDDDGYHGGFRASQIDELLASLDDNHMGWSAAMAPAIMGNADRPELGEELTNSFCRTDPEIAKQFARVTFTSDNRQDLSKVTVRTLILQSRDELPPV
jgi:sigma-B regulation protein RsbQ